MKQHSVFIGYQKTLNPNCSRFSPLGYAIYKCILAGVAYEPFISFHGAP